MSEAKKDPCLICGSRCCKYFCFEIDEPDSYEEFDDIRWFLMHRGVSVHIDDGDWYISIANRCKMLDKDGRCKIYDDRPLICRRYSPENCDLTGGDYGYDEEFEKPEDIEKYARKVLGEKVFDRTRKRARAKADKGK